MKSMAKLIAIAGGLLVASLITSGDLIAAGVDPFDPNSLSPTAPPVLKKLPPPPAPIIQVTPAPVIAPIIEPVIAPVVEAPKAVEPAKAPPTKTVQPQTPSSDTPSFFEKIRTGLSDILKDEKSVEQPPVAEPKQPAPVVVSKPVEKTPQAAPPEPMVAEPVAEQPQTLSKLNSDPAHIFDKDEPAPIAPMIEALPTKVTPTLPEPVEAKIVEPEPAATEKVEVKTEPEKPTEVPSTAIVEKPEPETPGFFSQLNENLKNFFSKEPKKSAVSLPIPMKIAPPPVVEAPVSEPVVEKPIKEQQVATPLDPLPAQEEIIKKLPAQELQVTGPKPAASQIEPLGKLPQPKTFTEPLKTEQATAAPNERLTTIEKLKNEKKIVKAATPPATKPKSDPNLISKLSDSLKDIFKADPSPPAPAEKAEVPKQLTTEKTSPFHPEAPSPTVPQPRFIEEPQAPVVAEPVEEAKAPPVPTVEPERVVTVERKELSSDKETSSPGFFENLKNRVSGLFSPPSAESMIAADKNPEEKQGVLKAEPVVSQQANLPPAETPITQASFEFKAASLGLGSDLFLGQSMQSIVNKQKPTCLSKVMNTKHYCLVKANWPSALRAHFDISNVVYRGTKGMVQFDEEKATRFYSLFTRNSFDTLEAHYTKLYGPPMFKTTRNVRTLLKGTTKSKIVQWSRKEPGKETYSVLELREVDDIRSNLPDLDYGVFRVYQEGTTPIFKVVSPLDFFDMG